LLLVAASLLIACGTITNLSAASALLVAASLLLTAASLLRVAASLLRGALMLACCLKVPFLIRGASFRDLRDAFQTIDTKGAYLDEDANARRGWLWELTHMECREEGSVPLCGC
jgi:hypothetical protein